MNTLTQKLNIAKLYFQAKREKKTKFSYFQADKKRIAAAVLLFALVISSSWASLAPNTLADDFGYYYGSDAGYSDYGYSSYSSPSYDYFYGSVPSYSYDYSSYSTPAYSYDYNSAPSYDYYTPSANYDYYYGSVPSYSYDYSTPSSDYNYYSPIASYDYYYSSVPDYNYDNALSYSYDYYTPYSYGDYYYDYYQPDYYTAYDYYGYGGYGDSSYDYKQNYVYSDTYNYHYTDYYSTSTLSDIISPSYPDLNVYKAVKNITKGEGAWQKITSANQGDKVSFSIKVASTGRGQANNVSVRDVLPYQLSYITGTTRIDDGYASDNLFSTGGLFLGYIPEGQTRTITFEASVTSTGSGYSSTNTYVNYAYARGEGIYERSDTADVVVSSTYTPYTPSTPATPSYSYYTPSTTYYPSYTYTPSYTPSYAVPSAQAAAPTVKTITGANSLSVLISLMLGLIGAGASYMIMRNSNRFVKMKLAFVVLKNKLFS